MEIYRGKPVRRDDARREVWEVQGRSIRKDGEKENASAKKRGEIGKKQPEIYG